MNDSWDSPSNPSTLDRFRGRVRQFNSHPLTPTPVVTIIMAICIVLSVISVFTNEIYYSLGFVSFLSLQEPWRFLTSGFIHFGPAHLAFNMWALYLVGPSLEWALGKLNFITLYLVSILGGSVFVWFWESYLRYPPTLTGGASGAIFGLFAALLILQRKLHQDIRGITVLVAINLAWGFLYPGVSWQGHVGGLIVGALYAFLVSRLSPRVSHLQQFIR